MKRLMDNKREGGIKIIATNRKAHFNYFLSDYTECGIVLKGTEIKSLRVHSCSIGDSYVIIRNDEAEIINMHINPYEQGNMFNQNPTRNRKLLLHKKEIKWFAEKVQRGGFSIIPTRVYFRKGKCKVEIALGKGKKAYDKRETIKERDIQRNIRKGEDY